MVAKKQWHKPLNYFSILSNIFLTTTSRCMKDGFLFCLGASSVSTRPLDSSRTAPMAIPATQPWAPHTTLNRPGTSHTVFTVENREWEGTGTNGNEEHRTLHRKKLLRLIHHADLCFKGTTKKTQSMRRELLSLTAFYKRECVDYVILF